MCVQRGTFLKKIEETIAFEGTQILIQGGLHPDLGLDYYTALFEVYQGAL